MSQHRVIALSRGAESRLRRTIDSACGRLLSTLESWPPERPAPVFTVNGKWHRPAEMWTDWTPGFLAGELWILAKLTGRKDLAEKAEAYTVRLAERRFDRSVHDLGFIFLSSYGRWLDALDPEDPRRARLEDVLVTAGTVQSYRWSQNGPDGFIYSFNGPQSLFIDVLMNVRLLFWAARHGAPVEVGRRALEHCRTSAKYLVRRDGPGLGEEDGRVAHEAIFNTEPGRGEFRSLSTQQGYSPFTCWSRGLAWAMYGFAEAYRYTGDTETLAASRRCARYYLAHTGPGGVPPWDYGAPEGAMKAHLDSSASAIAGCAFHLLLTLAGACAPSREADALRDETPRYQEALLRIAEALTGDEFASGNRAEEEGLLLRGVYHLPRGWGVDASVLWGDYFFLELLERLL